LITGENILFVVAINLSCQRTVIISLSGGSKINEVYLTIISMISEAGGCMEIIFLSIHPLQN